MDLGPTNFLTSKKQTQDMVKVGKKVIVFLALTFAQHGRISIEYVLAWLSSAEQPSTSDDHSTRSVKISHDCSVSLLLTPAS